MASELYSRDILRLASSLVLGDHLANPDAVSEMRAPLCGSTMRVEAVFSGDSVKELAITANACALGQASAAILRQNAIGTDLSTLSSIRDQLAAALASDAAMPTHWADLMLFEPARSRSSRHGAILLPFDALMEAANLARSKVDG